MLDQHYELRHLHDDLAPQVRRLMLVELLWSLENNKLYFSRNFADSESDKYPSLLRDALAAGTPDTLDDSLAPIFRQEVAGRSRQTFAWDEFNKFYMRALCRLVTEHSGYELIATRGRHSLSHRNSSDVQIGESRDAVRFLNQLRNVPRVNPFGANSGLTLALQPRNTPLTDAGSN
jgi:hypothetical protein